MWDKLAVEPQPAQATALGDMHDRLSHGLQKNISSGRHAEWRRPPLGQTTPDHYAHPYYNFWSSLTSDSSIITEKHSGKG